jgi:hypothetical protein
MPASQSRQKFALSPTLVGSSQHGTEKTIENSKIFLQKLFENGRYLEDSFRRLCADGCSAEVLRTQLYATSFISAFMSNPEWVPPGRELLVNSGNVSQAKLDALPKKLRAVADTIEELNDTVVAPTNEIKFSPPFDSKHQNMCKFMIRQYEILPQVSAYLRTAIRQVSKDCPTNSEANDERARSCNRVASLC